MRVLIIGAGIGGLATALRLRHAGIGCAVYEQSESVRELGVGINLLPNTVAELAEVGLLDELCEAGVRTRELRYAHRLGPEIMLRRCLAGHSDPETALRSYEAERLPVTSDVVLRNRLGGPERVIDEVERRAPDGFSRLADVIDPAELEKIVSGYARASRQSAGDRATPPAGPGRSAVTRPISPG